jgi:hypothetical protein
MVSAIELFHCTVPKLLIRKRYYVLFLIPAFIVQVTKLVQFTQHITFFENSTVNLNALCNSCEDMACCSSVQCTMYCTVNKFYLGNLSEYDTCTYTLLCLE